MRISDWSSDVCSSDLAARQRRLEQRAVEPLRILKRIADRIAELQVERRRHRAERKSAVDQHGVGLCLCPQHGEVDGVKTGRPCHAVQDQMQLARARSRRGKEEVPGDLNAQVHHGLAPADHVARSEEHTSELQSLMSISYAVF